jgi:hypothetical protein
MKRAISEKCTPPVAVFHGHPNVDPVDSAASNVGYPGRAQLDPTSLAVEREKSRVYLKDPNVLPHSERP